MNKITKSHIKDIYEKVKEYYFTNKDNFLQKTQKHIVEDIKNIVLTENQFTWNDASLTDYINDLIYMIKGQQFARTINRFAEEYFIENICKDFANNICENAKESLRLHKEYYAKVTGKEITNVQNNMKDEYMQIKNIILYGAPGVGKTHNYKNLICMIEEGKSQKEIFDTISKNLHVSLENETFEKIKEEKRVEFVTFHQSYSYEDFIEGFRPQENGNIELENGILKKLADEANNNSERAFVNEKLVFTDALKRLFEPIEEGNTVKINLKRENSYFEIYDYDKKTLYYTRQGRNKNEKYHSLSIATLGQMYKEEQNDIISGGLKVYYEPLLEKLLEVSKEKKVQKETQKNFYIVIDEINRGNISKIFGELITLIEEDKRDKYEVTLPYSKTKFKVPSNLYIIATMNSTDKSIATIDIALRRRFTFLKMQPNLELVKNEQAKVFMQKANEYISEKLGEDYMLGHSYFMGDVDLDFIKEYKIKPLLEEYFYADEKSSNEIMNEIEDKRENI